MITGSIKTHTEPYRYKPSAATNDDWQDYQGWNQIGFRQPTPSFSDQPRLLEEAVSTAAMMGFVLGARVKRRNGIDNQGTITHIHNTFGLAWNYSTGELEPFKVLWDCKPGTKEFSFDYGIPDLEFVAPPTPFSPVTHYKGIQNENLSDLHQSC